MEDRLPYFFFSGAVSEISGHAKGVKMSKAVMKLTVGDDVCPLRRGEKQLPVQADPVSGIYSGSSGSAQYFPADKSIFQ